MTKRGTQSPETAHPPPEVSKRKVRHDFYWRNLSVLGLARKYGLTREQIEEILRR